VRSLNSAVVLNNWQTMAAANREVHMLLSALTSEGEPVGGAFADLEKLRNAHQHAQEHCARELEKVGKRLEELREHKEGWIAYALSENEEEAKA
jgi:hypothetical protein